MKTVFQISDCHLCDESSYNTLKKALLAIESDDTCDTILVTGDICCNPKLGDYTKFASFVQQHTQNKRIYAIAGNHDDSKLMREELRCTNIQVVDNVEIHGRNLVFLDSSHKPIDTRHPLGSGRVDNFSIAKLKKQLRKLPDPIVVIHHPIIPVGSEWMKAICLENDSELLRILRRHNVSEVLCGHGHDGIVETRQGVTQYMAPSTAFGFDHAINEYSRSEKIGVSKISLSNDSLRYQPVYI